MKMDQELKQYIDTLTSEYPQIESIWLLGARANNSYKENSDWDLLIFSDEKIFTQLKKSKSFKNDEVDLLVAFNGDNFECPWPDKDKKGTKKGNLTEWEWKQLSPNEATYKSVKYKSEEWFKANMFESKILKAVKLWPL